jgi:hypothetical protein
VLLLFVLMLLTLLTAERGQTRRAHPRIDHRALHCGGDRRSTLCGVGERGG